MLLDQRTTTLSDRCPVIHGSGAAQEASLDAVMPEHVVRMRQTITVRRMPAVVFAVMQGLRESCDPFAALLEEPRPLGSAEGSALVGRASAAGSGESRWIPALDEAPRRMVAGAVVRLWGAAPSLRSVLEVEALRGLLGPGVCSVAFELRVRPGLGRSSRLTAEMRLNATDEHTARRLRARWKSVALGVHIAVRSLLSTIRYSAEGTDPEADR